MAYQINGNVVIDDSGNGSFTNFPAILRPVVLSPVESEEVYGGNITVTFTAFSGVYELHQYSILQVANSAGFESGNIVFEGNVAASNVLYWDDDTRPDETTFYVRGKYIGYDNIESEYGPSTSFCYKTLLVPPEGIGCAYCGGYFIGNVCVSGACYYIIASSNAEGCGSCQWRTSFGFSPGTGTDGYQSTYNALANATHPAGNFTATRTINGYSDWYLPNTGELQTFWVARGSLNPQGQGMSFGWSSLQVACPVSQCVYCCAWTVETNGPSPPCYTAPKTCSYPTRAFRREAWYVF